MTAVASPTFPSRTQQILETLRQSGQLKHLQTIEGPMDATVRLKGYGEVACFCSNNYLGLANHPEVVEAGIEGIRRYGAGTASVRFICGTFDCHHALEARIAGRSAMSPSIEKTPSVTTQIVPVISGFARASASFARSEFRSLWR